MRKFLQPWAVAKLVTWWTELKTVKETMGRTYQHTTHARNGGNEVEEVQHEVAEKRSEGDTGQEGRERSEQERATGREFIAM